jgi:endonuclease I
MKKMISSVWKILIIGIFTFFFTSSIFAQIPPGYYQNASGKSGIQLLNTITEIIDNHHVMSYSDLWSCFLLTDTIGEGQIWDIYSTLGDGTSENPLYWSQDQCVSVSAQEGDCYNREHLFCQSWFGSTQEAPYSDLFHIYPVDGLVNTVRNNNPFGVVENPSRTFTNGSKYGLNTFPSAPNESAFEPIDAYKGDIARSFFYMVARYQNEDANFSYSSMTTGAKLKPWALNMLMQWHLQDPVSPKEHARNAAVYLFQHNRNPFIDYPELVSKIWGTDSIYPFVIPIESIPPKVYVSHFSLVDNFTAKLVFSESVNEFCAENLQNYDLGGSVSVINADYANDTVTLSLSGTFLQNAYYYLSIRNILGENQLFMNDTLIPFLYNYANSQHSITYWTFDELPEKPNTPSVLTGLQSAVIYCNNEWGSSSFITETAGNELSALSGTTLGDPRQTNGYAGKALAFSNLSANNKSFVLNFSTQGFYDISLTFVLRRSGTGFKKLTWSWSIDGVNYEPLQNGVLQIVGDGEYKISGLDLRHLSEVDNCENLYLRAQLSGATSATGNLRIDNITVYGSDIATIEETEDAKNLWSAYPNPTKKWIILEVLDENLINLIENDSFEVQLLSAQGKILKKEILQSRKQKIDLDNYQSGVYFICLTDKKGQRRTIQKLIIQ